MKHLAFSLKQSDHRKAAYMARKLNLILFEIAEDRRSILMPKEALEELFQAEIARMTEHMVNLKFAGQRTTEGFHQFDNLANDIETGWAYRLLEIFASRHILFESENCKGRRYLHRSNVPQRFHQGIATTYLGERADTESQRFLNEIRALMEEHGVPYSDINVERAKEVYFKARADVLLNTEGRYAFDLAEFDDFHADHEPVADEAARENPVDTSAKVEEKSPEQSSANMDYSTAAFQQSVANQFIAPPSQLNAGGMTGVVGRDLAIKNLMKECEGLIANNRETWREDTAEDVRVIVRIFTDVLHETGLKHVSEIRQQHIAELRQHFNNILANWGRSSRYRSMTPSQLRQATKQAVAMAARTGNTPPKVGLSNGTIRRHLGNLEQFLKHLTASGYALVPLTMQGIKPKKRSAATIRYLTEKPGPEQIRPIFDIPVFTGCAGP